MIRADRDGAFPPARGDLQISYLAATEAWESEGGRLSAAGFEKPQPVTPLWTGQVER